MFGRDLLLLTPALSAALAAVVGLLTGSGALEDPRAKLAAARALLAALLMPGLVWVVAGATHGLAEGPGLLMGAGLGLMFGVFVGVAIASVFGGAAICAYLLAAVGKALTGSGPGFERATAPEAAPGRGADQVVWVVVLLGAALVVGRMLAG